MRGQYRRVSTVDHAGGQSVARAGESDSQDALDSRRPSLVQRSFARRRETEHRDRFVEQSAVLLVERGVDQPGLNFRRHFGGNRPVAAVLQTGFGWGW